MNEAELKTALRHFLDEDGLLKQLPAKYSMKLLACEYLRTKLERGRIYTEQELNALLDSWTVFYDHSTMRREMCDAHCVGRDKNGARYWAEYGDEAEDAPQA